MQDRVFRLGFYSIKDNPYFGYLFFCGFNKSVDEIGALDTGENVNKCKSVGAGILSRVIVFANKLFANISGSAPEAEELISINTGILDAESVRDSWRENY